MKVGPGFHFLIVALGVSTLYFIFKKDQHLFEFTTCFSNLTLFDHFELEELNKMGSNNLVGHSFFLSQQMCRSP